MATCSIKKKRMMNFVCYSFVREGVKPLPQFLLEVYTISVVTYQYTSLY